MFLKCRSGRGGAPIGRCQVVLLSFIAWRADVVGGKVVAPIAMTPRAFDWLACSHRLLRSEEVVGVLRAGVARRTRLKRRCARQVRRSAVRTMAAAFSPNIAGHCRSPRGAFVEAPPGPTEIAGRKGDAIGYG